MCIKRCLVVVASMCLAACGGGSAQNDTTAPLVLSGTAATGAPIAKAEVLFKCSSAGGSIVSATTFTDANGAYRIAIPNAQVPCLLQVSFVPLGEVAVVTLNGYAAKEGMAHITPLTHALLTAGLNSASPNVADAKDVFAAMDASTTTTLASLDFDALWNNIVKIRLGSLRVDTRGITNPFADTLLSDPAHIGIGHDGLLDDIKNKGLQPAQLTQLAKGENIAPTPVLSLPGGTTLAGATLGFSAAGSTDLDGTLTNYAWDFGDGSAVQQGATLILPTHGYTSAGAKTIRLTVTDNQGASSTATAAITIVAAGNAPPIARFLVNNNVPSIYQEVRLDPADSTDSDGSIIQYTWDWGDGTAPVAINQALAQSKAYTNPGVKTVRLTVTDNQGASSSATATVTVQAVPLPTFNISHVIRTTLESVTLFISNVFSAIQSVIWSFGDGLADQPANVVNGSSVDVSQTYVQVGNKTITATYKDGADGSGNTLGTATATLAVSCPATYVQTANNTCVPTYTLGGSVTGLSNSGLVLANGGSTVAVAASGGGLVNFAFPAAVVANSSYAVTVQTQPAGQFCTVAAATGTITGPVSNVAVSCLLSNTWTWMGGGNTTNTFGRYGTLGTPGAANVPGARKNAAIWSDSTGGLWLMGGFGYVASGGANALSDMWKYDTGTQQWTWVGGPATQNSFGVYVTRGVPNPPNAAGPGARSLAAYWTDKAGDFWLMGGQGYASSGSRGQLNDLWKYAPQTKQWTWMSGSSTINSAGVYGGAGNPLNVPGAREQFVRWIDSAGNLWLMGGSGYGSAGFGLLNDLWQYNIGTKQWTWMGGSNTTNSVGVYGTLGTANAANVPGARRGAASWVDSAGDLWLMGGFGYAASGVPGELNDLWKYSISEKRWTWVGGSNTIKSNGVYGGAANMANVPGARLLSLTWVDKAGDLWLMGGSGLGASGTTVGTLNDLWKYNISSKQWTWVRGANSINAAGVYGSKGVQNSANQPGANGEAVTWSDPDGNLWLFGGSGNTSTSLLSHVWKFVP